MKTETHENRGNENHGSENPAAYWSAKSALNARATAQPSNTLKPVLRSNETPPTNLLL